MPHSTKLGLRPEIGKELGIDPAGALTLSAEEFVDLCRVHLSDLLDSVEQYSFWDYRREVFIR